MKNLMIVAMVVLGLALISVAPAAAQGSEVPHSNGRTEQADYATRAAKVGDGTTTNFGADKLYANLEVFQGGDGAGAAAGEGCSK